MWILDAVYSLFWNSLLDFVFFIIIDAFAKITLGDSRTPGEKKTIWFGESVILALTSIIIYFCDHTPVVLIFLTMITFVYTQSSGMVNVRNWYISLKTRWEEYQQHQDSVERMRIHLNNQQAYFRSEQMRQEAAQRLAPYNRNVPFQMQQQQQHGMYPVKNLQQSRMGFASNTQANLASNQNFQPPNDVMQQTPSTPSFWSRLPRMSLPNAFKRSSATTTTTTSSDDDHYQLRKEEYSFSTEFSKNLRPNKQTPIGKVDYSPPIKPSLFGENLGRRPLRRGFTSCPESSISESSSLKKRFISAFGFSSTPEKPPGLRNEGQNLCFMNSILQCLARTPNLIQSLSTETSKESECTMEESLLLTSIVEILENCKVKGSAKVLDPIAFRQAASSLPNSVVALPTQRQAQQDAAEFYMWFMDSLHCLLNKNRKSNADEAKKSKASERLKTLKFIYGDLNPAKLQDLKSACKQEIDQAHGLQNNSYAEPVQRLSDLEWLTYKADNNSIIDNSFTGQLVIGYHCLTDNRITVNMQTFNILPVPIVPPREVSGLVMLADCFTTFCNVEHLTGQDALDHNSWCPAAEKCTTPVQGLSTPSAPKVNGRKRGFSSVDSAVGSLGSPLTGNPMSPIPGNGEFVNDSGFQDTVFKTSTPIADSQFSFIPQHQRLKDAQRRCLLRQLPECLVIQLMRFNYNPFTRQSSKVQAPVSIPLRDLDLTQIMFDTVTNREDLSAPEHTHKYDLYGVCVHLGADTTSYGHYISYCLQSDNNTWYKFDDEDVTEVNMEYELTMRELRENAYILFYKKAASSPS
ncbi:ubiquitin carboxyl-terminal hydrolase 3-like [Mizuhopecten yessoensis]|uniref:ubiquitinyl hydrolase 1 n=1 Tax=Mizuhopecten yessoensis TaxID=6573 RepID=A0A210Q943_MIZYE|nr:ubiquitin carboxyl-terminal hydrolase 3-like [Mizuhopecten yessoensis]OWF45254.1 Ubiquitin carboxyl-terminal hydrolase 33 [Mizuhopecten yessoensis]